MYNYTVQEVYSPASLLLSGGNRIECNRLFNGFMTDSFDCKNDEAVIGSNLKQPSNN